MTQITRRRLLTAAIGAALALPAVAAVSGTRTQAPEPEQDPGVEALLKQHRGGLVGVEQLRAQWLPSRAGPDGIIPYDVPEREAYREFRALHHDLGAIPLSASAPPGGLDLLLFETTRPPVGWLVLGDDDGTVEVAISRDRRPPDAAQRSYVRWQIWLDRPDTGERVHWIGGAFIAPKLTESRALMVADMLRHDDWQRVREGLDLPAALPLLTPRGEWATASSGTLPNPHGYCLQPIVEVVAPDPLQAAPDDGPKDWVGWKFSYDGRMYGSWTYLQDDWQRSFATLIGELRATEHVRILARHLGAPMVWPPTDLKISTGSHAW